MSWRQYPERVAWVVLVTSFLTCCVLTVVTPLALRSYFLHSTRPRTAYLTALAGTAQLQGPAAEEPTAVTERRAVPEGSQVMTDSTAKALITLFADGSNEQAFVTIQLFQDSAIALDRARTPRFNWSRDPELLLVELKRGRVLIATQHVGNRALRMRVDTPQANVSFGAGTFDINIQDNETQVRARSGTAQVAAAGTEVEANSGERVTVPAGRAPTLPVPGAQNLVLNGEFTPPLAPAWKQIAEVATGLVPGEVRLEMDGPREVVRFSRRTEDGAPNKVGVAQVVNRDVQGYDSLVMHLDLKLLYQSVPGGGYLASEYPIMVDIFYTDIYGKDLHWFQGFYYMSLPSGSTYVPPTGEQVPADVWYSYESPNLFDLLKDTRPAHVNTITIYASGHDYDSMISAIDLSAR